MSAHREGESSMVGSSKIQSIPDDQEVVQEPPQNIETTVVGETSEVLEVIAEPPQIDPTST